MNQYSNESVNKNELVESLCLKILDFWMPFMIMLWIGPLPIVRDVNSEHFRIRLFKVKIVFDQNECGTFVIVVSYNNCK